MAKASKSKRSEIAPIRDTVESVGVAIILAFVLRAFTVEAFVIPTGSMAPRLLGEHWDLKCPSCGLEYAFGLEKERRDQRLNRNKEYMPSEASCPNCGCRYDFEARPGRAQFINSGDRVLVLKYLYRLHRFGFAQPRPWDVIVFKNPQNNRENYIKRLIGLPGETIEIVHGDIFVKNSDGGEWRIRRKPRRAQQAMWQTIFDNDYRPSQAWLRQRAVRKWEEPTPGRKPWHLAGHQGRRFASGGGERPAEIVFRGGRDAFVPHYGYNASSDSAMDAKVDVCSDLKLSFTLVFKDRGGKVSMTLTSFEHRFRAELHYDGTAVLWYPALGEPAERALRTKIAPFQINRGYEVAFTHVDFGVALELDGRPILEVTDEYPESYESLKARLAQGPIPIPQVRIAAQGRPCELWHVRLARDVYYTSARIEEGNIPRGPLGDYARELLEEPSISTNQWKRSSSSKYQWLGWGTTGNPIRLRRHPGNRDLDEFYVLGDNSPQSLDGRAWISAAPSLRLHDADGKPLYQLGTVPRYNLIGKAMFVYWPSGFRLPKLPGLPIIPNVGRMRMIR